MAKGKGSEEFVVLSRVRAGSKREFEFAMKVQSEICGSLGRTRSGKTRNGVVVNVVAENSSKNKRLKTCSSKSTEKEIKEEKKRSGSVKTLKIDGDSVGAMSEEEAKSDVVDIDEPRSDVVELESQRGVKEDMVTPNRDEELKNGGPVEVVSDNDIKSPLVELGNDLLQPANGDETAKNQEKNNDLDKKVIDGVEGKKEDEPAEDSKNDNGLESKLGDDQCVGREANKEPTKDLEEFPTNKLEEAKQDDRNCPCGERIALPAPVLVNDDGLAQNMLNKKPFVRRFTRSALKPKVESLKESSGQDDMVGIDVKGISNSDNGEVVGGDSPFVTPVRMSKKGARNFPTKLKDLLDSGILEGLTVKYIRGLKVKDSGANGLRGVVKGSGILCFCDDCKGLKVVTPAVYEVHAGSSNKRPPEYIYLENGNTLRDVMNTCKDAPLATLEESIQKVIGCSPQETPPFCLNCRVAKTGAGTRNSALCNSCLQLKESQASCAEKVDTSERLLKSTLAPNSSQKVLKASSSRNSSQGRITRKDLRLHKLVFEEDVLPDGTEVGYYVRGQKLLVGYKKGFGIFCTCCNSEVSSSQFEAHAGWASRRKPFQHIYTSNGVSLHELSISLSISLSKDRKLPANESDDLCSICSDGGNLLCCDICPRAFHVECVSLPCIPSGAWYCRYCINNMQKEKFVERNANAIAAGRVEGVDPIQQITQRCIRIIKTTEAEVGGCVLCRGHGFTKQFGPRTVILCDQCEREYHVGCLKDHQMQDLKELPKGKWFCCTDCNRIHSVLQKLISRGEEKLPDSSLSAIRKKHEENGSEVKANLDIRWRVLSGQMASEDDTRVLLSRAVAIFHDRFDPIIDSSSTKDLIPGMVYGRTVKGRDLSGMYCAILTVNQTVVSAGLFRIFGQEMAELPLVATSSECQAQGYFQCLFSCIEKLLGFLNVKNLVLPAADEAESIWINKFGFSKMTQDDLNKYRRHYQMMIFQGTSMLQKPVPKCRIVTKSEES